MNMPEIPQVDYDEKGTERWWQSKKADRLIVVECVVDIVFILTLPVSTAFHIKIPQGLSRLLDQIPPFADRSIWIHEFFALLTLFAFLGVIYIFLLVRFRPDYKRRVGKGFLWGSVAFFILVDLLGSLWVYNYLPLPGAYYFHDRRQIFCNILGVASCILFGAFLLKLHMTRPKPEVEPPAASKGPEGQS